jgi:hypothetical protein
MIRLLKTLLISAHLASAPNVFAQSAANGQPCGWTKLGESTDKKFNHYIDYCKISSAGRYRFALTMSDYKGPQKISDGTDYFQSSVQKRSFDCSTFRQEITAIYRYQSNLATGPMIWSRSYPANQWGLSNIPGSVGNAQIEAVCK